MSTHYFKVLNADGSACHGGTGKWSLPRNGQPGEWMPYIGELVPCASGYHVCTAERLVDWLGSMICEVEVRGEVLDADGKCVVHQARILRVLPTWTEKAERLFAADCAERVLPIHEKRCPGDDRPRKAIEAARAYARGEITRAKLNAAGNAAWAAAGNAARNAERKWQTERLFNEYLYPEQP